MIPLSVITTTSAQGGQLFSISSQRSAVLSFTTGAHGYDSLQVVYQCDIEEAFRIYDRPGLPHVTVSAGGGTIWEGRLEDVAIVDGGVRLGAFGYQRALSDTLYTASFTAAAASAIAASLVADVAATNSTQLNTSTALISSPGTTFTDSYEDARPADILNRLAAAGDTSGNAWEWGVYDNQTLHFRQRGSAGRAWYVDAASLELERSLDKLYNSAYGVYTAGGNVKSRTSTSTDSTSVSRYGITREAAVGGDYYDTTVAGYARDAYVAQYKTATPRARVKFSKIYDASGAPWPLYYARAGDTLTIRNLPATASTSVDNIRTFYIVSTTYAADNDTLDVELSADVPTLDRQISQAGGNISGDVSAGGGILTVQPQYSFGTWTPAFSGSGTAGTFTYSAQYGFYTRIGNIVTAQAYIAISAIAVAPTGDMKITGTGLPTSSSTSGQFGVVSFGWIANLVYPAGALQILGTVAAGATTIDLAYSVTNAARVNYPAASFTNAGALLIFTITYRV